MQVFPFLITVMNDADLDMENVFRALADSTRRQLLDRLFAHDGLTQSALCDGLGMSRQAVSQHLTKLKLAGLVRARRDGRRQIYFIDDPDMVTVMRLMVGQLTDRAVHAPIRRSRRFGA